MSDGACGFTGMKSASSDTDQSRRDQARIALRAMLNKKLGNNEAGKPKTKRFLAGKKSTPSPTDQSTRKYVHKTRRKYQRDSTLVIRPEFFDSAPTAETSEKDFRPLYFGKAKDFSPMELTSPLSIDSPTFLDAENIRSSNADLHGRQEACIVAGKKLDGLCAQDLIGLNFAVTKEAFDRHSISAPAGNPNCRYTPDRKLFEPEFEPTTVKMASECSQYHSLDIEGCCARQKEGILIEF